MGNCESSGRCTQGILTLSNVKEQAQMPCDSFYEKDWDPFGCILKEGVDTLYAQMILRQNAAKVKGLSPRKS